MGYKFRGQIRRNLGQLSNLTATGEAMDKR